MSKRVGIDNRVIKFTPATIEDLSEMTRVQTQRIQQS